jgi:hypothetical protein
LDNFKSVLRLKGGWAAAVCAEIHHRSVGLEG